MNHGGALCFYRSILCSILKIWCRGPANRTQLVTILHNLKLKINPNSGMDLVYVR